MRFGAVGTLIFLLAGCDFGKPLSSTDQPTMQAAPAARGDSDEARRMFVQKTNARLREYNERLRVAYERGQKVCNNLVKEGFPPGRGCPRPKPKYEPMLKFELE